MKNTLLITQRIIISLLIVVLLGVGFGIGYWAGMYNIASDKGGAKNEVTSNIGEKNVIARTGGQVKVGTQYYSKIYIITEDENGNETIIHTFNEKANEEGILETVKFLDFNQENREILIHYDTYRATCEKPLNETECSLWRQLGLENGIYTLNLETGSLSKTYDILKSKDGYSIYDVAYDKQNNMFIVSGSSYYSYGPGNPPYFNALTVKGVPLENTNRAITFFSVNSEDDNFPFTSIDAPLYLKIIDPTPLCMRLVAATEFSPRDFSWNAETGEILPSSCSVESIHDDINFDGGITLTQIQEIRFGTIREDL